MTDSVIIAAYPGFWFHVVPCDYKSPFKVLSFPVIAWRVKAVNEYCEPVVPFYWSNCFDNALEYPTGQCVDDRGTGYAKFTEWRDASKASFDEACAEDDLEMELSEGAH